MDPNQKNQNDQATSHVVIPAPSQPDPQPIAQTPPPEQSPVTQNPFQNPIQEPTQPMPAQETLQPDPQASINQALKEQAPNMYANWTPPQHQSAFQEMNSPQIGQTQNQEPGFPHQVPPKKEPGRYSKRIAIGMLALLAIVGLPATIYLTQQQQTVQQNAAPVETSQVIAKFMGQDITKAELQKIAEEQYAPEAVDTQALKDALDTKLERMVLDKEAQDKDIQVTDSEIQEKMDNDGLSQTEARYAVLRDKVTETEVKNWQVYTIGFWQPSNSDLSTLTDEEKTTRSQILAQGRTIINEAKTRLANESAFTIAKDLVTKNPNFQGVLAVNGYQIDASSERTAFVSNPKVYQYEANAANQPLYKTIYSMTQEEEIKVNDPLDGSGEDAIKLVSFNNSSFNTYDEWLADKESSKITVNAL